MSLRDKLKQVHSAGEDAIFKNFGVVSNPYPTSNQTAGNPHYPLDVDDQAEDRILTFIRDGNSEVLVVLGTQGVGKTNFLNYIEQQVTEAKSDLDKFYVVRYLADPEPSFDATIRTIFQELGTGHLKKVATALSDSEEALSVIKSFDLRQALTALRDDPNNEDLAKLLMEWLLGFRLLNAHRYNLGVSFRLDTVESRTSVLRDYVLVSSKLSLLGGIFLLLDELEKQAGTLGPTAVVRYLSSMRAIIDALPKFLFMIIALTPDAMRRYASALPAFRSRLENQIVLSALMDFDEAKNLASFYLSEAKKVATRVHSGKAGTKQLVTEVEMSEAFAAASKASERRGDEGVRQREFLNTLHSIAEQRIQKLSDMDQN